LNSRLIINLKATRSAIIIGEIAALLHDIGKCSSTFPKSKLVASTLRDPHMRIIEEDQSILKKFDLNDFFEKALTVPFQGLVMGDIINKWELDRIAIKDFIKRHAREEPKTKLIAFMQIADRKDSADDRTMPLAKQEKQTYISSVFGKEIKVNEDFLDQAREDFYSNLSSLWKNLNTAHNIQKFRENVYFSFNRLSIAPAETRRAANDVSLMDHSYATASIMKALLADDVLQSFPSPDRELLKRPKHWKAKLRILGVGWDATRIFAEAQSLSGIAGRWKLIEDMKKTLQNFLEYEYSLGNIIYEDQNLICFLVPENTDQIFDELQGLITQNLNDLTNGLIVPAFKLSEPNAYPSKVIVNTIKTLRQKIKVPILSSAVPKWVNEWNKVKNVEICVECGKRPRSKNEDICNFCSDMKRKGVMSFVENFAIEPSIFRETVWMDEIADENGNIALVCGTIPLEGWLDGALLKSMFVKTIEDIKRYYTSELEKKLSDGSNVGDYFLSYHRLVNAVGKFESSLQRGILDDAKGLLQPFLDRSFTPTTKEALQDACLTLYSRAERKTPEGILEVVMTKAPSPSRFRKIWKETEKFFKDLSNLTSDFVYDQVGEYCLRLKFTPRYLNDEDKWLIGAEKYTILEVDTFNPDTKLPKADLYWDGIFMYTTMRLEHYVLDKELKKRQEQIRSLIEDVMSSGKTFAVLKIKNKKVSIGIESYEFERYIPTRTILVSPYLFAIIVPGKLAVNLLQKKYLAKYEEFSSKVFDRLQLNIGTVFFKRKFPLYVVLDVMNRFTEYLLKSSSETRVFNVVQRDRDKLILEEVNADKERIAGDNDVPWLLRYEWKVDDRLGDDTVDLYHANFMVKSDTADIKNKDTYFEINMEDSESVLNLKDIEPKMLLKFYPSFFDFHFLKSSGERFDLFSSIGKRLHPALGIYGLKPYLLKDLNKIIELWRIINPKNKKLTISQVKKLEHICITIIGEWSKEGAKLVKNPVDDEVYRMFVESSVKNVCRGRLTDKEEAKLVQSILSGIFFDVVELFITLKSYTSTEAKKVG